MRLATVSGLLLTGARPAGPRLVLGCGRGRGRHRQQSTADTSTDQVLPPRKIPGSALTLAIETSCDDTCVAILEKHGDRAILHFNAKVTANNVKFGGVEPVNAVESHAAYLAPLIHRALRSMPTTRDSAWGTPEVDPVTKKTLFYRAKPSFISVTRGPGMSSALSVGLTMAKGLSVAWKLPMVAVHHMQAHALTPRLVNALARPPIELDGQGKILSEPELAPPEPQFPFLSLLVSGGHTQLLLSESITAHTMLAEAQNVAIGDMLDKCARAILPASLITGAENVMYAAQLELFAFPRSNNEWLNELVDPYLTEHGYTYNAPATRADEIKPYVSPTYGWTLTPPLAGRRDMVYDFSGLGGQVRAIVEKNPDMGLPERLELARETMRIAFEHLASRLVLALDAMRERRVQATRRKESSAAAEEKQDNANDGANPNPNPNSPDALKIPPSMDNVRVQTLVVAGGVASNDFLLYILKRVLAARGYHGHNALTIVRPPAEMCTDNAAMVAWAATEMWEAGWSSSWDVLPARKWSMDNGGSAGAAEAEKEREGGGGRGNDKRGGILELDGWKRRQRQHTKDTSKPEKAASNRWKLRGAASDRWNPRQATSDTWNPRQEAAPLGKRNRKDPDYKGWVEKMLRRRAKKRLGNPSWVIVQHGSEPRYRSRPRHGFLP